MSHHWDTADVDLVWALYHQMLRIRMVEERIGELVASGDVGCPCHLCIGQEAVPVGVCATLRDDDYLFGGHRSHGHYLAKGGDLPAMMAEILGRVTGCARGRGGAMHLVAPEVGILGMAPIVAATIPMAVGAGMASVLRGDGRVAVACFGDGAADEGTFHEAMNLAAVRRVPVVFVCENNLYASHLPLGERRARDNIVDAATLHGMPGVVVDGNDVLAVRDAAATAVGRARDGLGPTLVECRTYRWRGHVGPAEDLHVGPNRSRELDEWTARDPVAQAVAWLDARGTTVAARLGLTRAIAAEIERALLFARESAWPVTADLPLHRYAPPTA